MAPPRRRSVLLDSPGVLAAEYAESGSIAEVAQRADVSTSTVRRALIRYGIARLPRNRNRRPASANVLDDKEWLKDRYQTHSGVEIAAEVGVSSRAVYAAMDRHGLPRRVVSSRLKLHRPQLVDSGWLHDAVQRGSSTRVAAELGVSPGTVTAAYRRAGIDPGTTTKLFARGHTRLRPDADELRAAWSVEGTYRGVGRRLGVAHSTAAVWLAEIDLFVDDTPRLGRRDMVQAIAQGWPLARIANEHRVSITTVRVDLHRHQLFDVHRVRHKSQNP